MKFTVQLVVLATCILSGTVFGEDVIEAGGITKVSDAIGNLIHLKWGESRLKIDRDHWDNKVGVKTEDEKLQDKIAAMVKRGIPEDIAKRMADGGGLGRRGFRHGLGESPEGKLFEELKVAAGAMSGGSGGSNVERHWRGYSQEVAMMMHGNSDKKSLRFMIRESIAPFQEFILHDHPEIGLRIQFTGVDRLLIFSQSPDGAVRVAHSSADRSDAFHAPDYGTLVTQQPSFAKVLTTLLQRVGVNKPLTRHDSDVIQTAGRLLLKPDTETNKTANAVIGQLNAASYPAREEAQKQIVDNFAAWRNVIREKLQDQELEAEIRVRLQSIMDSSDFDQAAAEEFIETRKLLDDAEYLRSIVPELPAGTQPDVEAHIEGLNK